MKPLSILAKLFATDFYLGCLPTRLTGRPRATGGGTLGTVFGMLILPLLPDSRQGYAVFLLSLSFFAVLVAHKTCADSGIEDDQRVVIDETVGYLFAVAWLPHTLATSVLGFVLFRAFDGLKPWPIRQVDASVGGGLGVVLDDILAGIASNLVLRGLFFLLPFTGK